MSPSRIRLPLIFAALLLGATVGFFVLQRPALPTAAEASTPHAPRLAAAEAPRTAGGSRIEATVSTLKQQALPSALQRSGAQTFGEAILALAQMEDGPERTQYLQAILREALARDPASAAEFAAALADGKLRNIALGFVLTEWGAIDPPNALRWAVTRPDRDVAGFSFFMAYEGFAARDATAALRWLQHPEFEPDLDQLSRIVIGQFHAQQRLAEARMEIEKLPEGALRDQLARRVVAAWGAESPAEAANWLAATASDATFRAGFGDLVHTVADRDPHFAAGLTQQFSDPKIRGDYLADIIYLWARTDLGGAASWLRMQPTAPHLDAAIARIAEATAKFDPVEATEWLSRMSDPAKREELRRRLFK